MRNTYETAPPEWYFSVMVTLPQLRWPLDLIPDITALRTIDQFADQFHIKLTCGLARALLAHFIVQASISWKIWRGDKLEEEAELEAVTKWFVKMVALVQTLKFRRPSTDQLLNGVFYFDTQAQLFEY